MSEDVRTAVRERYGSIAKTSSGCCGGGGNEASSCCGANEKESRGEKLGYSFSDLESIPGDADLGLGCGNPTAIAAITEGNTVVDLGSGGGIDCFLAAKKVGSTGHVIGVDMTADMIERARSSAQRGGYTNVEFRLGEIEHVPVADASADIVISNCVINLSPDKAQVFREAHRVLKDNGKLMVSDIVVEEPLPDQIKSNMDLYAECVAGAMVKTEYLEAIREAGFTQIEITKDRGAEYMVSSDDPTVQAMIKEASIDMETAKRIAGGIRSIEVLATK